MDIFVFGIFLLFSISLIALDFKYSAPYLGVAGSITLILLGIFLAVDGSLTMTMCGLI